MLDDKTLEKVRGCLRDVSPDSRVYIGCDSGRRKDKETGDYYAFYVTAVVIHKDNSRGCRVFCSTDTMMDYDQRADRPTMRMMNEAMKSVEAYQQLEEDLLDFDVEVHLDINTDPSYGSNAALNQARGYVVGVTGLEVKTKPDAFAASFAADRKVIGKKLEYTN